MGCIPVVGSHCFREPNLDGDKVIQVSLKNSSKLCTYFCLKCIFLEDWLVKKCFHGTAKQENWKKLGLGVGFKERD